MRNLEGVRTGKASIVKSTTSRLSVATGLGSVTSSRRASGIGDIVARASKPQMDKIQEDRMEEPNDQLGQDNIERLPD